MKTTKPPVPECLASHADVQAMPKVFKDATAALQATVKVVEKIFPEKYDETAVDLESAINGSGNCLVKSMSGFYISKLLRPILSPTFIVDGGHCYLIFNNQDTIIEFDPLSDWTEVSMMDPNEASLQASIAEHFMSNIGLAYTVYSSAASNFSTTKVDSAREAPILNDPEGRLIFSATGTHAVHVMTAIAAFQRIKMGEQRLPDEEFRDFLAEHEDYLPRV